MHWVGGDRSVTNSTFLFPGALKIAARLFCVAQARGRYWNAGSLCTGWTVSGGRCATFAPVSCGLLGKRCVDLVLPFWVLHVVRLSTKTTDGVTIGTDT